MCGKLIRCRSYLLLNFSKDFDFPHLLSNMTLEYIIVVNMPLIHSFVASFGYCHVFSSSPQNIEPSQRVQPFLN
jgi:hypothetical protein